MSLSAALSRFVLAVAIVSAAAALGADGGAAAPKVDFSYAFAAPHRIAVGRPDASDRTLLDLAPGSLRMAWTYDNLTMPNYPPLAWRAPPTLWSIQITPQIDGKPLARSRWSRLDGVLPALENVYEDARGSARLEVFGGMTAALIRIEIANGDSKPHQFVLRCDSAGGENPAWLDAARDVGDNLVAGWNDRADRVLILGLGADAYSLQADGVPPGPRNMILVWNLKPGEKRHGWIVRPYRGYVADLPALRRQDWAQEMEQMHEGVARSARPRVQGGNSRRGSRQRLSGLSGRLVHHARADLRRPYSERARHRNAIARPIPARQPSSPWPWIKTGSTRSRPPVSEARSTCKRPTAIGTTTRAGDTRCGVSRDFKTWTIMEHYRLAGDKKFLAELYPQMLASSRWQERQRARSRTAAARRSSTYGLMPRGMGDCGLMNDGDVYGVFLPHNFWAVYADRCSLEAAEILGKTGDLAELKKIFRRRPRRPAWRLLRAGRSRKKAIAGFPACPARTSGSCWGALNVAFPCGLLPPNHELVTGTLRKIESNMSKGGQPIHTGWMADGAWVAITLDNVAEVHLARGNGDAAADISLLHAQPRHAAVYVVRGARPETQHNEYFGRSATPLDAGGGGSGDPRHDGYGKRRRTESRLGHGARVARLGQAGRHRRRLHALRAGLLPDAVRCGNVTSPRRGDIHRRLDGGMDRAARPLARPASASSRSTPIPKRQCCPTVPASAGLPRAGP